MKLKKLKQNIILLLAAIAVCLVLLEISARVAAHFSHSFLCDTYSNPDDWFLCRLEFDLGRSYTLQNQSAIKLDSEICDKWDLELGWVPNPSCNSTRNSIRYSTNSVGFRNSEEFKLAKSRKRIMILGDSFTWGENNNDNETYPFYLYKMYNGSADVINMGVHGYGPDQFYLYFIRNGLKYKPDVVVFGLFLPGIHRTAFSVRSFFKPMFIIENGELKIDESSTHIPDLRTSLLMSSDIKKKMRIYSVSYILGAVNKLMRLATAYEQETSVTLKIIEKMNSELEKDSIKMVVLLIPEQEMVEKGNTDYYGVIPKITKDLEEKGIDYINLQPVFKKEFTESGKSLYQGHLKKEGNMVVARELFRGLGG